MVLAPAGMQGALYAPAGISVRKSPVIPSNYAKSGYLQAFRAPNTRLEEKSKKNWVLEGQNCRQYPPT